MNRRNFFQRTKGRLIGVLTERFSTIVPVLDSSSNDDADNNSDPNIKKEEYCGVEFKDTAGDIIELIQNEIVYFNVYFFIEQIREKFLSVNGKHFSKYVQGLGSIDLRPFLSCSKWRKFFN